MEALHLRRFEDVLVEVCLDSADSAVAAQQGGARRVELCDNLLEGGTTPSAGMIAATRAAVDVAVQVMIRPRGGDFCYTELEVEAMLHDIRTAAQLGADGVVFGALTPEGDVDVALTRKLLAASRTASRSLAVTFHRAFDMCRDPLASLDVLVELGVDRLLTSGQEATVADGVDLVADLVERAGERLVVMPGCGITPRNVRRVVDVTGAREIHVVGNDFLESPMRYRNPRCFMGGELRAPEYRRAVTSADAVRAFAERLIGETDARRIKT